MTLIWGSSCPRAGRKRLVGSRVPGWGCVPLRSLKMPLMSVMLKNGGILRFLERALSGYPNGCIWTGVWF